MYQHNPKGCWRECFAAALALFCALGINATVFSVYVPYLKEALELTHAQSNNFIVVRNVFTFGSMFIVKAYYDKLEIRLGYCLTILMAAVSVFLYANAQDYVDLCIAAIVSGLAAGLGGMFPVAILIHRWFHHHEGLALGICAAATGVAITVGTPILTTLIENHSVGYAMYCEIAFLLVCGALCFFMLRNYPKGALHHKHEKHAKRKRMKLTPMCIAAFAIGGLGGCFNYLTIHYSTEGFDPYQISTIVSVAGMVLTVAKLSLGEIMDLLGAYRTNWVFLPLAISGCLLIGLFSKGMILVIVAVSLYVIGNAISTVGLTAYAKDLSTPEQYAAVQQQYQTAYQLGTLSLSVMPGIVATLTGHYGGYYLLIAILMTGATAIIQNTYGRKIRAFNRSVRENYK